MLWDSVPRALVLPIVVELSVFLRLVAAAFKFEAAAFSSAAAPPGVDDIPLEAEVVELVVFIEESFRVLLLLFDEELFLLSLLLFLSDVLKIPMFSGIGLNLVTEGNMYLATCMKSLRADSLR